jgi:MFS transporter, PPP family, 3-phenylpropionic acid transporter
LNPAAPAQAALAAQRRFAALWFCAFAAVGAFAPYAPLWFQSLGYSTWAIGALAALQAWTRVFAPYAWGWLGDHWGHRRRLLIIASVLALLSAALLLWVRSYAAVAVVVVALFAFNAAMAPLTEAAVAQHLPQGADGQPDSARYARVRMWGSIGFMAAVLGLGAVLQAAGIAWFPLLVVVLTATVVAAAWGLPRGEGRPQHEQRPPPVWPVLRQPVVAWMFASIFATVLAHTALYTFFSLYLVEHGWSKATVGVLWALAVLVEIAFFWWQGRLWPQFDPLRWLAAAGAVSVLRFAMTALGGGSLVVLVLAQSLHAVTFAAQHVACIKLINQHFPPALRTRGQALYLALGYGASGVIGGMAGGALSEAFGLQAVFWGACVAAAAGWACAWRAQWHSLQNTTPQAQAETASPSEATPGGR